MRNIFFLMVCSFLFSTCSDQSVCKGSIEGALSPISLEARTCLGLDHGYYAHVYNNAPRVIIDSIDIGYINSGDTMIIKDHYVDGLDYHSACYDYKYSGKTYHCEDNPDPNAGNTVDFKGAILTFWTIR